MKKTIISFINNKIAVIAITTVFILALGVTYTSKLTTQTPLQLLRAQAAEDPATAIGSVAITRTTAGDFWHKPTDANGIKYFAPAEDNLSSDAYAVGIFAAAGTTADKTFTVNLWLWRPANGPAQKICSIAYTTGTMQMVKYPNTGGATTNIYWADTAVVTSYWFTDKVDTADADGNNGCAMIIVRLYGEAYMYAEVLNADGVTGTEATNVSLYYCKISG